MLREEHQHFLPAPTKGGLTMNVQKINQKNHQIGEERQIIVGKKLIQSFLPETFKGHYITLEP